MMELKIEFFDGIGTPLGERIWTPRDGILWISRDVEQLRITENTQKIQRRGLTQMGPTPPNFLEGTQLLLKGTSHEG
jgi:hypothetical protein